MKTALGLSALCIVALLAEPAPLRDLRRQGGEPDIVLQLEQRWAGVDALMPLTTSIDPVVRHYALRAVGRLRDPRVVPRLLAEAGSQNAPRGDIASAIAGSLRGFDPQSDPKLITQVADWMYRQPTQGQTRIPNPVEAWPYLMPMSRMRYANADQVHRVEGLLISELLDTANRTSPPLPTVHAAAADAIGWLARENPTSGVFTEGTVAVLTTVVEGSHVNDSPDVRFSALTALVNARSVGPGAERAALEDRDEHVRRLAMNVLGASGGGLAPDARLSLARAGLDDPSPLVRYEALRAYVRRGGAASDCQPILDLFADSDSHVALAAIDAVGSVCPDSTDATDRVAAEVRTPPISGAWNIPAHAFVALAKRAPDRAVPAMGAFATHPLWWVRLYAVKAAVAMKDVRRLERLALDDNDNVRAAAIGPLRELGSANADAAILDALKRPGYELVLAAANLLKKSPADDSLAAPLVSALLRITAEHKDTSRDTRLALLDAIAEHGDAAAGSALLPLAKDVDPQVAARAASVVSRLTGRAVTPDPPARQRGWPRQFQDLRQCVQVNLASGRSFVMQMLPEGAPVTVDRFLTLAIVDHYYDGLSFHRVEPNFVIQGGSPEANEHSGAKDFMRDEIALGNARGTVGLSTRGLNTGDAQFYVNLVDNRRLDDDYTVFARVTDMTAVDRIEEGELMTRMSSHVCPK